MSRTLKALITLITFSTVLAAQTAPRKPLEGVWKIVEVVEIVDTGADGSKNANPQPNLFIFTRNHYSMMLVPGTQPRASFKVSPSVAMPTDQEKIAAFDSFVANTGTYEVTGSTLTIRPIVARYPNFMGGSDELPFRIEGNTLWLTGQLPGPKFSRFKLIRVE